MEQEVKKPGGVKHCGVRDSYEREIFVRSKHIFPGLHG
jgi:hypothetical protein